MRLGFRSTVTTLAYLCLACGLSAQFHYHVDHAASQTDAGLLPGGARDADGTSAPVNAPSSDDCPTCHQLTNGSPGTIALPIVCCLNDDTYKPARLAPEQLVITRFAYAPTAPRAPPSL